MDKNKINQFKILQDDVSAINVNTFNLPGYLEMLNATTDTDVQVNLFSILSAYLMLNESNVAAIITYNPLYDKICNILSICQPRKTIVALNFLSALLYFDQDTPRKKSLVAYAKNMIRNSGCLATMSVKFTNCMMHQDAWRALCRCLAETCRGIEVNQSYCTHLVPMCVQRCCLRNIEVLQVLQSLLQNHNRNISLFIECDGLSLFQREFLQHDVCLQLLATIAQSSIQAVALIVKTNICQQLRDFLHLYGPQSQLSQWATVILYHTARAEASYAGTKECELKEINHKLDKALFTKIFGPETHSRELECSGDTTKFYQNVMKEMIQCGAREELKNAFLPSNISMKSQRNAFYLDWRVPTQNISHRKPCKSTHQIHNSYVKHDRENIVQTESLQFNKTKDLSFSFLRKRHLNQRPATAKFAGSQPTLQTNITRASNAIKNTVSKTFMENSPSCIDFNPKYASTPKKIGKIKGHSGYQNHNNNTIKDIKIKRQLNSKKVLKHLERSDTDKEIKHRSISGRVFDVINTSCTTLVKTVKNIFRPKSVHETKDSLNQSTNRESLSCSYSFTNYMCNRDAILNNKSSDPSHDELVGFKSKETFEDLSMDITNGSCNTCNDTRILKHKLTNDDHLKRTIRKLKLGINLYGCNFKKISRVMWPNERYMTPVVIYNLYRKLIIK